MKTRSRRIGCLLLLLPPALFAAWVAKGGWRGLLEVAAGVSEGRIGAAAARVVRPLELLHDTPEFTPQPPGSEAGARILARLERIEANTRSRRYQHATDVNERRGRYLWDCSGMVGWVLRREAPRARAALGERRPVARRVARTIARAPTAQPRRGWQQIERLEDVRPGDVFAWERPVGLRSRNTGHTGFVLGTARLSDRLWAVRITDSTSYPHQDDTRGMNDGGGLGRGTLVFPVDAEGRGTGYRWHGTDSLGTLVTPIRFGRIHARQRL
ncbi:MAG: hypothetical protein AB8I08_27780 [Sandaracinaceae bacterium]